MTALRAQAGDGGFVVDETHLGVTEHSWLSSPQLASLGSLAIPAVSSAIVVAPHPDDEILGAAGLLQVLAGRGVPVQVCAVTDGEASIPPVPRTTSGPLVRQSHTKPSSAWA